MSINVLVSLLTAFSVCVSMYLRKTTVARLYGSLLKEIGAISGDEFQEVTGGILSHEGVPKLQALLDTIEKAKGGCLFIDEAYLLLSGSFGKSVLDVLLPELENKVGSLVVIFAGYKSEMDKLFQSNQGLPSRVDKRFVFPDYNEKELLNMLVKRLKEEKHRVERDELLTIGARRLARQSGREGFGNMRSVTSMVATWMTRQSSRLSRAGSTDKFLLIESDILGPNPCDVNEENCAELKELMEMIGLEDIKKTMKGLIELAQQNFEREKRHQQVLEIPLNRLFLGNPGTGKTTVAKLYGKVLARLDMLSKGEVIVKYASDFIGSSNGQSEEKTNAILKSSEGCVLVIDEAYSLFPGGGGTSSSPDPYKSGVIDTIVQKVQGAPGDDRCVLMLGYKDEMGRMMRDSNPGLSRRFAVENAFMFNDYNDDELMRILNHKLKKRQVNASLLARLAAIKVLSQQRRKKNFGNGGAVENLVSMAIQRGQARGDPSNLNERDFAPPLPSIDAQMKQVFDGIIGCHSVLEELDTIRRTIEVKQNRGEDYMKSLTFNYCFTGPPGTGKTTIAKRMGLLFHSLGILGSPDVRVATLEDLVGQFLGQTAPKVKKLFEECVGQVLFIDEAYRLADPTSYTREAVDQMVDLLTQDAYEGKMIVILAGYSEKIDHLLSSTNEGLRSRFTGRVEFPPFESADCTSLLRIKLKEDHFSIPSAIESELAVAWDRLRSSADFSSGRDVTTISRKVVQTMFNRCNFDSSADSEEIPLTASDIVSCIDRMVAERSKPSTSSFSISSPPATFSQPQDMATQFQRNTSSSSSITYNSTNIASPVLPPTEVKQDQISADPRDAGVSDAIWQELQQSKWRKRSEDDRLAKSIKDAREEAERIRLHQEQEDRRQRELKIQTRLKSIGVCPMGYDWLQVENGYRCSGGSHFVDARMLNLAELTTESGI